ncbi:MAG: hypothetical protein ACRC4W_09350 [Treponemataceae bacterium]
MLNFEQKVLYLEKKLSEYSETYADSFKEDVHVFIGDFVRENPFLCFLDEIATFSEIDDWINKLLSRIVLKFFSRQK